MSQPINELRWKIGGEAGFGIMATGTIMAKTCLRLGLQVFDYSEYPSLIRGGHNTYQIFAADRPVFAHETKVDMLVALNQQTITDHLMELRQGAVVIYDRNDPTLEQFDIASVNRHDIVWVELRMVDMTIKLGGLKLMRNMIGVGASCALAGIPLDIPVAVVRDMFKGKGPEVQRLNEAVVSAGYQAVAAHDRDRCVTKLSAGAAHDQVFVSGNDAIGLGALHAGCKYYSAYPMTPASSILHFMAEHGPSHGVVIRHAEDEIAAINQAIGAAYTGVRAMTGTAGGGFALMTEAVGMAAMTEVGIVIAEAQRGGPSTGLPTWTEQGDLRQVLHASQGDFPRVVLAPVDMADCFELTYAAFNIADQLQTPVVVMTDKYLAESHASIPAIKIGHRPFERGKIATEVDQTHDFPRYRTDDSDGVSPRTLPGTPGGMFLANSDEHTPEGYSEERREPRLAQMDKRQRKMALAARLVPPTKIEGPDQAAVTFVTWGSSAGPVREAVYQLQRDHHIMANVILVRVVTPFPVAEVTDMLQRATVTIMVEANQSGQMAGVIREQTGQSIDHHIRRYDGRPFDPAELVQKTLAILT